MNEYLYLGLLSFGFVLILLSSLGSKSLYDVAWHELKEFALRRNRRDRFDAVHDNYEEVIVGLDIVRFAGLLACVIGGVGWYVRSHHGQVLETAGLFLGCGVSALILVAMAVWMPAAVARLWSAEVVYHLWPLLRFVSFLVWPLVVLTKVTETVVRRLADETEEPDEEEAFEDEILAMVTEGLHDGHLEADAREMIEGVIVLGDANVADIMTPRDKMDALDVDGDWDSMLCKVAEAGRTRVPVYEGNRDTIIGVLYVKDLLAELAKPADVGRQCVRDLMREVRFVPASQPLDDLLQNFLKDRNHLAIAVDEYGGVIGLVTIEDVLEEIVGEIVDESDKEEHAGEIHRLDPNRAEIHGRAHLAEINEALGLDLPEPEDFDTIAGFVVHHLGRLPKEGETIEWGNIRITVLVANDRKVERVRLESLEPLVPQNS
ncbi:MAG: HlyC/CorC family transporter [Planctomycetales bacterium]|nr:HlyC/CorC family transporter [Planctomycetales bacterium]